MAIELIAKIKQKNNGIFKLVDACDVEMKDGQDLQTCIDNLVVGEGLICVHDEGPTEEQIKKYEVFIDKSATLQETSNKVDNVFLDEIRSMFTSLQRTIDQQQQTIIDLVSRIKYLESLHDVVVPDEPITTLNPAILLENGGYLLTENGGKLIIEGAAKEEVKTSNAILLENGDYLLLENGGKLLIEGTFKEEVKTSKGMLLENGGYFLLENGGILLLEGSVVEETSVRKLLTEDGKLFLLENGGSFLLENSYIEIEEGEAVVKLENGGDLLLENGGKLLMELSEEEYNLLLETGKVLLTEKNGKIILE